MATDTKGNELPQADSSVAELQRVLAAYAASNNYVPADPGPATGIVDARTVVAVAAMIPRIPRLPSEIAVMAVAFNALLVTAAGRAKAFALITRFAGPITGAILAMQTLTQSPAPPLPASGGKAGMAAQLMAEPFNASLAQYPNALLPQGTIYYKDSWGQRFRVAVPDSQAGTTHKEIAPAQSPPASAREVSHGAFLQAIGKSWATAGNLAAAVGIAATGGLMFVLVRRRRRRAAA